MLFQEADLSLGWSFALSSLSWRAELCVPPSPCPAPRCLPAESIGVLGMDAPDTTHQVWLAKEGQVIVIRGAVQVT